MFFPPETPEVTGRENVRAECIFPVSVDVDSWSDGSMIDSRSVIEPWRLDIEDVQLKTWESVLLPKEERSRNSWSSAGTMRWVPSIRMDFRFSRFCFSINSFRLSSFLSALKWFLTPFARMLLRRTECDFTKYICQQIKNCMTGINIILNLLACS